MCEFTALYREAFDEPITDDDAAVMIAKCVGLLKMMAEDLPKHVEAQEGEAQET